MYRYNTLKGLCNAEFYANMQAQNGGIMNSHPVKSNEFYVQIKFKKTHLLLRSLSQYI